MPVKQYYNKRIGAWVKGDIRKSKKGGKYFKVTNVKQKKPKTPFKGVPKGNRRSR